MLFHARLREALGPVGEAMNAGQIYVTLARLEKAGLVAAEREPGLPDRPDRKVYELPPAGQQRVELASSILSNQARFCTACNEGKRAVSQDAFVADVRTFCDALDIKRKTIGGHLYLINVQVTPVRNSANGSRATPIDAKASLTSRSQTPQSIFRSHGFLIPCSYWIPPTALRIRHCFGCPNFILDGLAGLLRPFGVS